MMVLLNQCLSVEGNHEFLVGGDDADGNLATRLRDNGLGGAASMVLLGVNFDAHEFHALGGTFAYLPLVLTGTTREEDDIHTTHGSGILSNVFLDAIGVHLLSQTGTVVAFADAFQNVAEVAAATTHTGQSALLVQQVGDALGVEVQLIHQEGYGSGIDVTRTGAHDEAFEGSQAHAGVNALAILHGSNAGSVADVAGDDAATLGLDAQELAHTLTDVAVAGSVETIATYAMLLIQVVGQGIHVSVVGHGLVEGSVEHTYLWDVWQEGRNGVHALDVGRVVEGSQVVAQGELLHHLGGEQYALVELLSTVYHAVTYGIQLVEVFQYGMFACGEHFEDELHTGGMLLDGAVYLEFLAIELELDERVRQTDFLDTTTGDDALVIHVVQCVFDATASAVKY